MSPFGPKNFVSRHRFGRPVPRQPAHSPQSYYYYYCRLNLVLTHGLFLKRKYFKYFLPPALRDGVLLRDCQPSSGQSRVRRVTQLRTEGVHRQNYTGLDPVVLKVLYEYGCCALVSPRTNFCAPLALFLHPLVYWYITVDMSGAYIGGCCCELGPVRQGRY